MILNDFIQHMPKVELHVHIEGAIQPQILLQLANKNHIELRANGILTQNKQTIKYHRQLKGLLMLGCNSSVVGSVRENQLKVEEIMSKKAPATIFHSGRYLVHQSSCRCSAVYRLQ